MQRLLSAVMSGRANESILVGRMSGDGEARWAIRIDEHASYPIRLAAAGDGGVYVSGQYFGDLTLESETILTGDPVLYKSFISKWSAGGELEWIRTVGSENLWIAGIIEDSQENVHVTGYVIGTTEFDAGSITPVFGHGLFAAGFTNEGDNYYVELVASGIIRNHSVEMLDGLEDGTMSMIGNFDNSPIDFGGITLVKKGGDDIFLLSVDLPVSLAAPTPTPIPSTTLITGSYPNPAVGFVTIEYRTNDPAPVDITFFDLLGRAVQTRSLNIIPAGVHRTVIDVSTLPAGLYMVRLTAGAHFANRNLVVVN